MDERQPGDKCKHETGTWFDRTIEDGGEVRGFTRCNDCGEAVASQAGGNEK